MVLNTLHLGGDISRRGAMSNFFSRAVQAGCPVVGRNFANFIHLRDSKN